MSLISTASTWLRNPLTYLNQRLLLQAPGNRHGITLQPQRAVTSLSDDAAIIHMGVPGSVSSPWQSAAGGIGRDETTARLAAVGEAVERYCATIIQLPLKAKRSIPAGQRLDAEEWCLFSDEQRADPAFPFGAIYRDDCRYTNVYDFQTNQQRWAPHPLVALRDDYQTGVPTSSGLAAGPTARQALLRGIQELIERDALMTSWLHSLPGRSIALPASYQQTVRQLHGQVWAFELTPAYSPFPVIAVAGGIPKRGKWRYSLGVACRDSWQAALEKAYLEWNQGVLFAGIYQKYTTSTPEAAKLQSFDEHAIYYTLHPEEWHNLPLFQNASDIQPLRLPGRSRTVDQALQAVKRAFAKHHIRAYYRDLTTIDAEQLGLRVVRAASPDLAQIFAHQEWPLLGGLADMLTSRYPDAPAGLVFPNPMPHPLG